MQQLSTSEALAMVADGAVLLDVREYDEWDAGHAPDAVHMPMGTIGDRLKELDLNQVIVCVCRSGARSEQVARALGTRSFTAHNLAGGMQAWEADGEDVVNDNGGAGWVA